MIIQILLVSALAADYSYTHFFLLEHGL